MLVTLSDFKWPFDNGAIFTFSSKRTYTDKSVNYFDAWQVLAVTAAQTKVNNAEFIQHIVANELPKNIIR